MQILGMRLHAPSLAEGITLFFILGIFGVISWSGVALQLYTSHTGLVFFEGLAVGAITASIGANIARYKWRAMLFIVIIQVIIYTLLRFFYGMV